MKFNLKSQRAKASNSLKFIGSVMMLLIVCACNKDPLTENPPKSSVENAFLANYENGRLVFESQADFDQTINALKDLDERKLQAVFSTYYDLGFMPSYPHYKKKETERIVAFLQKKKSSSSKMSSMAKGANLKEKKVLEFDDPLISDDLFSSFLNAEREIIIEGKIYKYTYSGLLIASVEDSLALKKYVRENKINSVIPDPRTLPAGRVQLTPKIESFVAPSLVAPCIRNATPGGPIGETIPCGGNTGGGSTNPNYPPSTPSPSPDYTSSLVQYVDDLMPCNYDDATAFGDWTPFGTRKVCYEYFTGNKRRTKTLYSHEDFLVYEAVAIKVKHQRHHSFLGVEWFASDETDEVAVIITDAVFRITTGNMVAPTPPELDLSVPENNMIFYTGGYIVDPTATGPQEYIWPAGEATMPSTPFNEEVIVQVFNTMNIPLLADMNTTVEDVTEFFWDQVYDLAVEAGNAVDTGGETTRITMLLTSDKTTVVHYVDLSNRQLNTKKIKTILDYSWGASVSLSLPFNQFGQVITNPKEIFGHVTDFELGGLLTFDDIYMNFIGVTRRGSEWRGSNMVYMALDQN